MYEPQVDPDAPSPDAPKFRYFLHWLVTNIPGVDVQRGDVVVDYMGPVRLTPLVVSARKLSDCRIVAIQRHRNADWDFMKFASSLQLVIAYHVWSAELSSMLHAPAQWTFLKIGCQWHSHVWNY